MIRNNTLSLLKHFDFISNTKVKKTLISKTYITINSRQMIEKIRGSEKNTINPIRYMRFKQIISSAVVLI